MFNLTRIDSEITNRCNAACPLCPRTGEDGGPSKIVKKIGLTDLPIDVWDDIFDSEAGVGIQRVTYCGNFGDPMMHPQALETFQRVHSLGATSQKADTNASIRNEAWWDEIGRVPGMEVFFSIDGLKDTNHLYRVGTDFDKIIANANAFIKAGGKATWIMLAFKHNEHQIEEAKALSEKMGFRDFTVKLSSRAFNPYKDKQEAKTYNYNYKKKKTQSGEISQPKTTKFKPPAAVEGVKYKPISCQAMNKNQFYVTPDKKIIPCCHVHGVMSRSEHGISKNDPEFYNFLIENNIKFNLNKFSFDEIVSSYRENMVALQKLWDMRSIAVCNRKCGSNLVNVGIKV